MSAAAPFTQVTDALGRVTKYYLDPRRTLGRNRVIKVEGNCNCGSGSQATIYQYDDRGNKTKEIDALNREIIYTYDGQGNRLTMTDTLGTETYTYNALGQILTKTDRMNGVTTNTYSTNGNLLTTKDALDKTTTFTYSISGQLKTVTDALNHTTMLDYDTNGRLTAVKDADNKTTTYGYDARARITSTTNALSQTTNYEYDLKNRLKKITFPDTKFITYNYDLAGRKTAMIDARNNTTTFAYDNAYRLTTVTDPLNHTTTFGYDLMSNRTGTTDALNNTTNYEYDNFNRLKKIIYPPAVTGGARLEEETEYDAVGNVKKRIDSASRQSVYDYDTANRLLKITDANNQITQFFYNPRSQMTKVKDALNQEYVFTYDALGRVLSQTRAGVTMTFEYDAVGSRTKRIDYKAQTTNYVYDNLNRLTNINYANQSNENAVYAYDALSRLSTATNYAGTISFAYDNRGRIDSTTDVFNRTIEYDYDANGNRTSFTLNGASSQMLSYQYDAINRLTQITDDGGDYVFGYDAANRMTSKVISNGLATTYSYDGMNRLTELSHRDAGNNQLFNWQYAYNAANQIEQIADLQQTKDFTYDETNRLTRMRGSEEETYSYDAVGNRTASHRSPSYNYASFNRLSGESPLFSPDINYKYDANGNRTSKAEQSGILTQNRTSYNWDGENRLMFTNSSFGKIEYRYDALGRRVERIHNTQHTTKFIYDGLDVVQEEDSETGVTNYTNGLGIDNKLRMSTSDDHYRFYFLADHLGSTVGLTNENGELAESTAYDAFGNATNQLSTRYQYTGREYDSETNLYYYRARWYDSNLGRFISEDPIGFKGGDVNLYGYVKNNPIKYNDPRGTQRADRDRPGDQYPGMKEPFQPKGGDIVKDFRAAACAGDGYNVWLTGEFSGGLQFMSLGGSDSLEIAVNPMTGEVCVYTKLCSGMGGSAGFIALADFEGGLSLFGRAEGRKAGGIEGELFLEGAAFGGGSGSISRGDDTGLNIGFGPSIGGGAAGGLRICEKTVLFCMFENKCECKK